MKQVRGFTLIELLVVIAIIGILAGIVLASLGNARSKGNDAKVKEQVSSIRNAMETYYATNNSYGASTNTCTGTFVDATTGLNQLTAAGNYPAGTTFKCGVNATTGKWGFEASLSSGAGYSCSDSTGASTTTPATTLDVSANPPTDVTCG